MLFNKNDEIRAEKLDDVLVMADKYFSEYPNGLRYCGNHGQFYIYKDGYYQTVNELDVEKHFMLTAKGETFEPINYYGMAKFKNFIRRYAAVSDMPHDSFNMEEVLNLNNGLLDLKTGVFGPHSEAIFSTIRIPYNYDMEAASSLWLSFLDSSLEGDAVRIALLQEYMGYCLGRDMSFQKALFLIGKPSSGKGTILRAIQRMVGKANCSAVTLGRMNDPRALSKLVNRYVNIDADIAINSENFESDFNKITGQDTMVAKILYKDEFEFVPFCKLILAANKLPHIKDSTRAFYRRMMVIPFNLSFEGKEDRHLNSKLEAEASGILNWALVGRKRLYEQGDFTTSKDLLGIVEEIKAMNNPLEMYFNERIGFHDDKMISKRELYNNYREFCTAGGYHALSIVKFNREFIEWAGVKTEASKRHFGTGVMVWPSVYIRTNEPEKVIEWQE